MHCIRDNFRHISGPEFVRNLEVLSFFLIMYPLGYLVVSITSIISDLYIENNLTQQEHLTQNSFSKTKLNHML